MFGSIEALPRLDRRVTSHQVPQRDDSDSKSNAAAWQLWHRAGVGHDNAGLVRQGSAAAAAKLFYAPRREVRD